MELLSSLVSMKIRKLILLKSEVFNTRKREREKKENFNVHLRMIVEEEQNE